MANVPKVAPNGKCHLWSTVESEEVRWLWSGHIPLRMITILDGDPGSGKQSFSLEIYLPV